eukprot:jgi/Mesvir1/16789/Mv15159-RA.3
MEEEKIYDSFFRVADLDNDGRLGGQEAVQFFLRSGLPQPVLSQIWALSDRPPSGFLDRRKFGVALRLTSLAQRGQPPSEDAARGLHSGTAPPVPPPRLTGLENVPSGPIPPAMGDMGRGMPPPGTPLSLPGMSSIPGQRPGGLGAGPLGGLASGLAPGMGAGPGLGVMPPSGGLPPPVPPQELERYRGMFVNLDRDRDGKVSGVEARGLFLQWQLPKEALKQIWELADADGDGFLTLREFWVACVFLDGTKSGKPLPSVLPPQLQVLLDPQAVFAGVAMGLPPPQGPQGAMPPPPGGQAVPLAESVAMDAFAGLTGLPRSTSHKAPAGQTLSAPATTGVGAGGPTPPSVVHELGQDGMGMHFGPGVAGTPRSTPGAAPTGSAAMPPHGGFGGPSPGMSGYAPGMPPPLPPQPPAHHGLPPYMDGGKGVGVGGGGPLDAGAFISRVPRMDPSAFAALPASEQQKLTALTHEAEQREAKNFELEGAARQAQDRRRGYDDTLRELVLFQSRCRADEVRLQELMEREKAELEKVEKMYQEKKAAAEQAQGSYQAAVNRIEELKQRKAELRGEISNMERAAAELLDGRMVETLQGEVAELERVMGQLASHYAPIKERLQSLQDERTGLQRAIEELRVQVQMNDAACEAEEDAMGELRSILGELEASVRGDSSVEMERHKVEAMMGRTDALRSRLITRARDLGLPIAAGQDAIHSFDWEGFTSRGAAMYVNEDWDKFKDEGFVAVEVIGDVDLRDSFSSTGGPAPWASLGRPARKTTWSSGETDLKADATGMPAATRAAAAAAGTDLVASTDASSAWARFDAGDKPDTARGGAPRSSRDGASTWTMSGETDARAKGSSQLPEANDPFGDLHSWGGASRGRQSGAFDSSGAVDIGKRGAAAQPDRLGGGPASFGGVGEDDPFGSLPGPKFEDAAGGSSGAASDVEEDLGVSRQSSVRSQSFKPDGGATRAKDWDAGKGGVAAGAPADASSAVRREDPFAAFGGMSQNPLFEADKHSSGGGGGGGGGFINPLFDSSTAGAAGTGQWKPQASGGGGSRPCGGGQVRRMIRTMRRISLARSPR